MNHPDVPTKALSLRDSPASAAVLPLLAALAAEGRPLEATYLAGGWRVRLVVEPAESRSDNELAAAASVKLTDADRTILQAVAELPEAPTGQEIARAAGYPYDAHLKMRLSLLRRRGLLGGAKGETGYPLTKTGAELLAAGL